MPGFEIHDKWAQKLGISIEISNYINRAFHNIDVPEDFKRHSHERKIPRSKGGNISIKDIGYRRVNPFIQKQDLQFFSKKGKDYVKAQYLFFILHYLVKLKTWMKDTGEGFEDCIDKYQKNKKVTIQETEEELIEVLDFLKRNSQELQKDLKL